ncbi:MAG: WcbI family polysaccharide biosynthesis putative acetyltransferase [Crocosphaera sp.]|nr:WcbI family polysaccharide biosynthesis putative acetyltransferase [Crocosphaera sp.]
MTKVITFGNCQAGQIRKILSSLLPQKEFKVHYFSNNARTGNKQPNQTILESIRKCDILIYQPLSSVHEDISEENIRKILKEDCIAVSFPYIVNTGMYSLCHAPMAKDHKYGKIIGEDIIHDLILSGKSDKQILKAYKNNEIDFNLKRRFVDSLGIMRRKEMTTHIKLTEFIENNYKTHKLFVTHNHLTSFFCKK